MGEKERRFTYRSTKGSDLTYVFLKFLIKVNRSVERNTVFVFPPQTSSPVPFLSSLLRQRSWNVTELAVSAQSERERMKEIEREREREREREGGGQTDRQTERETDRQRYAHPASPPPPPPKHTHTHTRAHAHTPHRACESCAIKNVKYSQRHS